MKNLSRFTKKQVFEKPSINSDCDKIAGYYSDINKYFSEKYKDENIAGIATEVAALQNPELNTRWFGGRGTSVGIPMMFCFLRLNNFISKFGTGQKVFKLDLGEFSPTKEMYAGFRRNIVEREIKILLEEIRTKGIFEDPRSTNVPRNRVAELLATICSLNGFDYLSTGVSGYSFVGTSEMCVYDMFKTFLEIMQADSNDVLSVFDQNIYSLEELGTSEQEIGSWIKEVLVTRGKKYLEYEQYSDLIELVSQTNLEYFDLGITEAEIKRLQAEQNINRLKPKLVSSINGMLNERDYLDPELLKTLEELKKCI